jgi:hypothetical protein
MVTTGHARLSSALLVLSVTLSGCVGAYQMPVVEPRGAGGLQPTIEDKDAGLVGMARELDLKSYLVIAVDRLKINESDIKDDEDRRLAARLPPYFQSELVQRLRAAGIFERVVNLSETEFTPGAQRALRLEGAITKLAPGSRALRYFVGFGAGASKAQMETRFVDMQTGQVVLVTADRREAAFGVFGGDSEEHLKEAISDMARDLAKFVARAREAGGPLRAAAAGAPAGAQPSPTLSAVLGTWRGTLRLPPRFQGDGLISSAATLQISEQSGLMQWSLTSTQRGEEVKAAGTAELSGDTLRLSGIYEQPPRAAPMGGTASPPRVSIVYSGTLSRDALEATGLTGDNRVHVLSVRRVAQ